MTDSEFDALLRRALIDVIHEDFADILEGGAEVPPHTEKYLRRERKLLADPIGYVRRLARPVWKKALRTAACILLALATVFGAVMAVSPSARAWVVRMYIEWREESTKFTFFSTGADNLTPSDWRPSYVPDDFNEFSVDTAANLVRITYRNLSDDELFFSYRSLYKNGPFSLDSEHGDVQDITILQNPAKLFVSTGDQYQSHVTWMDEEENVAFMFSGFVDAQELVKMAESVEKTN